MAYLNYISILVFGPVSAGELVLATQELQTLVAQGKVRPDKKDVRLFYQDSEIDYLLLKTNQIAFRAQATIASGSFDTYALRYNNASETTLPKTDKLIVLPFYADGNDITKFTIGGPAPTTIDIPTPEFLKYGQNPTLTRPASGPDYKNVRDAYTLFYENGTYYCFYDGNDGAHWITNLASSTDLVAWTHVGPMLSLAGCCAAWQASASASVVKKFGSTYYMWYMRCQSTFGGQIPAAPYRTYLATASFITGPWTEQEGQVIGSSEPYQYALSLVADVFYEGGVYYMFYSCGDNAAGQGIALQAAASPDGPWTDLGVVIAMTEHVENGAVFKDETLGRYYLICNQNGKYGSGWTSDGHVLYWTDNLLSWNVANKVTTLNASYGEWDAAILGLLSSPVFRNGMLYGVYDGLLETNRSLSTDGHEYRDIGAVEAQWPFKYGKAFVLAASQLKSTEIPLAGFVLKIKAWVVGSGSADLGVYNSDNTDFVGFHFNASSDALYTNIRGTVAAVSNFPDLCRTTYRVFELRISSGAITMIYDGVSVASTTFTPAAYVYLNGSMQVESVSVLPLSYPVVSCSMPVDAPLVIRCGDAMLGFYQNVNGALRIKTSTGDILKFQVNANGLGPVKLNSSVGALCLE